LRAYNAAKCDCGRGSALDPAGGAYSAPPADLLAGFKGVASRRGGREGGRKWEGGKGGESREGGKMGGGEVDSDARSRRLPKAGPGNCKLYSV